MLPRLLGLSLLFILASAMGLAYLTGGLEKLLTPPSSLQKVKQHTPTPLNQTLNHAPITLSDANQQAQEALIYVNNLRQSVDLIALSPNPQLAEAAENHSLYSTHNNQQNHIQQPGLVDFSGKKPKDRSLAVDYYGNVSEVIAYNRTSAEPFIEDLMSAIYHRLGLFNMTQTEIGIGVAGDGKGKVRSSLTALLGNEHVRALCQTQAPLQAGTPYYPGLCKPKHKLAKPQHEKALKQASQLNPKMVFWPTESQPISPVFYEESPDPLPNCNVSGYPVHVQINPLYVGRIQFLPNRFKLFKKQNNQLIPVKSVAVFGNQTDPARPKKRSTKDEWMAFFPKHRLDWNSEYQAQIQWLENDQRYSHTWTFRTKHLPNIVTMTHNQIKLPIRVGQTLHLYFPPPSCQKPNNSGLRKEMPRSTNISTQFIDGETVAVTLNAAKSNRAFSITYLPTQTKVFLQPAH